MKKFLIITLTIMVLCVSGKSNVQAASDVVSKSQTLTFNVYDSIITSWKIISIKGKFEWNYNKSKKKLTKDKDISYSTPTCVIGCFVKNVKKSYPWWNTGKNETGKMKLRFTYGVGLDTTWISISNKKTDWMSLTAKGDGSYSWSFSTW